MAVSNALSYNHLVRQMSSRIYLKRVGILVIVYVAAATFGLSLDLGVEQVTSIWPPTGIALAALWLWGLDYWPGIYVGAVIANLMADASAPVSMGIGVGNTLEAVIGVYVLRQLITFDPRLERLRDLLGLIVGVGFFSTALSATIGTSSLLLGDLITTSGYSGTWLLWWIGDMMGALLVFPLLLFLHQNGLAPLRQHPYEAGIMIAGCAAAGLLVFHQQTNSLMALPYILFPFAVWASLRFAQAGAIVVSFVIATTAIKGTLAQRGPFALSNSSEQNMIMLQLFMFTVVTTALLMAISTTAQKRNEQTLKRKQRVLREKNRRISTLLAGAARQPENLIRSGKRFRRRL